MEATVVFDRDVISIILDLLTVDDKASLYHVDKWWRQWIIITEFKKSNKKVCERFIDLCLKRIWQCDRRNWFIYSDGGCRDKHGWDIIWRNRVEIHNNVEKCDDRERQIERFYFV